MRHYCSASIYIRFHSAQYCSVTKFALNCCFIIQQCPLKLYESSNAILHMSSNNYNMSERTQVHSFPHQHQIAKEHDATQIWKSIFRQHRKVRVFSQRVKWSIHPIVISHVLSTNNDIQRKFIFLTGFPGIWLAERSKLASLLLVEACGVPAPASAMFQSLTKHLCELPISDFSLFRDFWAELKSSVGVCEP